MDTQTSYKRTVAGSVGAGMGAIFNGSGRTYYMLEHKTSSKFHQAGETQKIIIDQVELGRDASCQVRFDESFDTVSRKHAAIERDGDNWKLVHLSASNPTLVNGRPIQGSYYLQSGDEIQLSVNGPRLGFIVPQGKQALTSSIKLTERMNLFRQQALRPYRRAIWVLGSLLALAVIGFGIWNYSLTKDNQALKAEMATYQAQMDSLSLEKQRLDNLEQQIQEKLAADPENVELKKQLADVTEQRTRVVHHYNTVYRNYTDTQKKMEGNEVAKNDTEDEGIMDDAMDQEIEAQPAQASAPANPDAKTDARSYYGSIYRIIVENITIEDRNGVSHPSNISTSKIDCGSGFITPNGTFVTARQNIQPWIYVDGKTPSNSWRRQLAIAYAFGNDIIINYSAYSTDGTAKRLQFSSRDFSMPTGGDVVTAHLTITDDDIPFIEGLSFIQFNKKKLLREGLDIKHATAASRAYATLPGTGRAGIPTDAGASNSIAGGASLDIVYYETSNVQNLAGAAAYTTVNTSKTDNNGGIIHLQSGPGATAFGAPVFIRESDGSLMVVGVYVGDAKVVPVHRFQ